MIVDDEVRKCVVFVGMKLADETFRLIGTAFFLGRLRDDGSNRVERGYLVTARHVIDGVRRLGLAEVWLRVNTTGGEAKWEQTLLSNWITGSDPATDVAFISAGIPEGLDHRYIPFGLGVTDKLMKENEAGLGDEVFITGLFRHHHGARKNVPIVRIGNLVCMSEEKVTGRLGEIDAYLIEARSIGGLSGSPVFLNLGSMRRIGGATRFATGQTVFLLGLVHGHFDVKASTVDQAEADAAGGGLTTDQVNTGIAIVVPFHVIESTISDHERRTFTSKFPSLDASLGQASLVVSTSKGGF